MNTKEFNRLISSIKKADKNQAQRVQTAILFCLEQAENAENLTPISKLLSAIGSARTIAHKRVKGYILAHVSGIVIDKDNKARKKRNAEIKVIMPEITWYEWQLEGKTESKTKTIVLDTRLEGIIKALNEGAQIQIKDKEKVQSMVDKLEALINEG